MSDNGIHASCMILQMCDDRIHEPLPFKITEVIQNHLKLWDSPKARTLAAPLLPKGARVAIMWGSS